MCRSRKNYILVGGNYQKKPCGTALTEGLAIVNGRRLKLQEVPSPTGTYWSASRAFSQMQTNLDPLIEHTLNKNTTKSSKN